MAIENNDLFVLQKSGGGELRKASVAALLAEVVEPIIPDVSTLDEVTTAGNNSETSITVGPTGSPTIELNAGGNITADGSINGNSLTSTTSITAGQGIVAVGSIQSIEKVLAGADAAPIQIVLDGTTGEIGGGSDVFIDGGEYA